MDFYNIKILYRYFPCIKNSYNVHISTFSMVFVQTNLNINSVSFWWLLLDFFSGVSSKKVEAWMNMWFAFFLSLALWSVFFTSLWGNHKDTWKKTEEWHYLFTFYSIFTWKSSRYLRIHSLHLSRARDWSRKLATQQRLSHQVPALCWESYGPGGYREIRHCPWLSRTYSN